MVKFHSWFTVCFPLFQNITHIEKVTMVNKGHSNLVAIRQLLPLSSSIRCFGLSTFVEHKNVGKFDISKFTQYIKIIYLFKTRNSSIMAWRK